MNGNLFQSIMSWVDARIAEKLRDIGVIGGTIDAGHIGGTLPDDSLPEHDHTIDNIQGRPITSDVPNAGDILQWNGSLWIYIPYDIAGALYLDASGNSYLDASDNIYTAG